jgi:hypothetical protein
VIPQSETPEGEDLHAAVVTHEQVVGLDVAMGDAALVGRCQPVGGLPRVVDGLAHATIS